MTHSRIEMKMTPFKHSMYETSSAKAKINLQGEVQRAQDTSHFPQKVFLRIILPGKIKFSPLGGVDHFYTLLNFVSGAPLD